jgi:hypothetical protein
MIGEIEYASAGRIERHRALTTPQFGATRPWRSEHTRSAASPIVAKSRSVALG